jgi:hypothetical protein
VSLAEVIPLPNARPPRILVATVLSEATSPLMARWQARLVLQETQLLWDVLVIEATSQPSHDYWTRLSHWLNSWPFGSGHKARLVRCPDGSPWRVAGGKFAQWRSYEHLLMVDIHALIAPDAMQRLADSGLPKTGGAGCVFMRGELRGELIEEIL